VEHLLDAAVMLLEIVVSDGPGFVRAVGLVFLEPRRIFANVNVGVDQRTTAETAGNERARPFEGPDVEHAVKARARVPEIFAEIVRRARERVRWVRFAALQQTNSQSGFGQSIGHHRAAETRTDYDCVKLVAHFLWPLSFAVPVRCCRTRRWPWRPDLL